MATGLSDICNNLTRAGFSALNRVVVPAVKAGVGSPLPIGVGLVVLETTGRSSGLPRQVPLVAARVGSRLAVSTLRPNSQWIKNLKADPDMSAWVGGQRRNGKADIQSGPLNIATLLLADSDG